MARPEYTKDNKVFFIYVATTRERIDEVKSSQHGFVVDGDRIYITYNTPYYLIKQGFVRIGGGGLIENGR